MINLTAFTNEVATHRADVGGSFYNGGAHGSSDSARNGATLVVRFCLLFSLLAVPFSPHLQGGALRLSLLAGVEGASERLTLDAGMVTNPSGSGVASSARDAAYVAGLTSVNGGLARDGSSLWHAPQDKAAPYFHQGVLT